MRSGMSLLTACGMVCLMISNLSAQSNTFPFEPASPSVQPRSAAYFPRGQQPAAPEQSATVRPIPDEEPAVQNYSRELFGTNPRNVRTETIPARPETPENQVIPAANEELPWASQKQIINAEFEQNPGQEFAPQVQQINATREVPASTQPFAFQPPQAPVQPAITPELNTIEEPTGPITPTVTLQWIPKSNINVGQPCECELVVKNTGSIPARDVIVESQFPTSVRLTGATPQPTAAQDKLVWKFATLAPEQEQIIKIQMIPSQRGEIATQASIRFTGESTGVFRVKEPMITLAMEGPNEVMVGDPASQIITVSNPGTGVAHNVIVEAIIPAGLEHTRGTRLVMEIGSLNPGENRKLRLALAAVEGGKHTISLQATGDADLKQVASADVNVVAPSLKVAIDGPGIRYKGRQAQYTLTVVNDGGASSNNVRVMHKVPEGFDFLSADKGGQYDAPTRMVSWFVGRLEPGQQADVKVQLTATQLGDFTHFAAAGSEHGARSEAKIQTSVEGTASLVLEILDLNDPVEVGVETAYEIRVRNDGSKAAQNVGISCELAPGTRLISAKGPAESVAENGLLVFKSLPSLEPGKTAIFRVHIQGVTGGNHRFRARLASDSIQEPLIFEEITKFYKD